MSHYMTRKLDGKPMTKFTRELDEFQIASLLPSLCPSSLEGVVRRRDRTTQEGEPYVCGVVGPVWLFPKSVSILES